MTFDIRKCCLQCRPFCPATRLQPALQRLLSLPPQAHTHFTQSSKIQQTQASPHAACLICSGSILLQDSCSLCSTPLSGHRLIPLNACFVSKILIRPCWMLWPDLHICCCSGLPSAFVVALTAAQSGAASSGRGGGTVAASISRGAMPLKEGFLMRNTLSSTSSTALSGVDAPLVTPATGGDISH